MANVTVVNIDNKYSVSVSLSLGVECTAQRCEGVGPYGSVIGVD